MNLSSFQPVLYSCCPGGSEGGRRADGCPSAWAAQERRTSSLSSCLNEVVKTENDQKMMESFTNIGKRLGQDYRQNTLEEVVGWYKIKPFPDTQELSIFHVQETFAHVITCSHFSARGGRTALTCFYVWAVAPLHLFHFIIYLCYLFFPPPHFSHWLQCYSN